MKPPLRASGTGRVVGGRGVATRGSGSPVAVWGPIRPPPRAHERPSRAPQGHYLVAVTPSLRVGTWHKALWPVSWLEGRRLLRCGGLLCVIATCSRRDGHS